MKLFVAGPPYSGLAVVGQALARAGVYLDGPLGMARTDDRAGLFINRRTAALHNEILAANGCGWVDPSSAPLRVSSEHRRSARALVEDTMGGQTDWAIIDPRAALLTELWTDFPDARWAFVIRPPAASAWSLMRRHVVRQEGLPMTRVARALRLWTWYSRHIIEFCRREPGRSAVLWAPEDFDSIGEDHLGELSGQALRLPLKDAYHHLLLRTRTPRWVRLQAGLDRDAADVWRALGELRDRQLRDRGVNSRRASVAAAAPRPVVCLASRRRLTISETFIRDHLRHLPGSLRWLIGGAEDSKRDWNDLPVASVPERLLDATLTELGHTGGALRTRALSRYLRRERVQVVLAEFGPVALGYIDACRATGIPLVAHFHGYDAYRRSTLREFEAGYRELFKAAHRLIVVSRDMAGQLQKLGAPAEKILWNPCGVDTSAFGGAEPEKSDPLFVSVGRFVEKKAPYYVLLAFQQVAAVRPDARLVMIGEGTMMDMCRGLCGAIGLSDRVLFAGAVSPAEVSGYMRRARAFVQHSIVDSDGNAEGTPVSILEAGASGLPVVATRHMGIADVVLHGETGLLVEEGDYRGMGEQLLALCDDPGLAGAMGRQARARICAEFSMEQSIGRLWSALESAMLGAGAQSVAEDSLRGAPSVALVNQ